MPVRPTALPVRPDVVTEYRLKPVTRYVLTRHRGLAHGARDPAAGASCEVIGEYPSPITGYQIAYALGRLEIAQRALPPNTPLVIVPEFDPAWEAGD